MSGTNFQADTYPALIANVRVLPDLPEQNMTVPFRGLLETLRRGQRSACVELIGDSTGDGLLVGTTTKVDEWPQLFMKRLAQDYPGYSLKEKRWNDANQGYDPAITWQTGTINGGAARCAVFAGAGEMTYSGAAITGDIDIRVKVAPSSWTAAGTLAAKWESVGNQRSWLLLLNANTGTLGFNWSTDGSTNVGQKNSSVAVNTVTGVVNGQPYWVRATLDVDNGATGNDLKFYTSPDNVTWTQLGTTVTTASVTSIFGGSALYMSAAFTSGITTPLTGSIYAVDVRAGLASQQSVVPPLMDDWEYASGETTVSFSGAPVLTFLNGSMSGQNVAYFDNSTRRPIMSQPHGQNVVLLNTSHNDGTQARQTWLTNYAAWVGHVQTLVPYVPIVVIGQNPVGLGGTFAITQQGLELRAARGAILQQWAASVAGVYAFDAWPALLADDTVDDLHPKTGAGMGADKWASYLYASTVRTHRAS